MAYSNAKFNDEGPLEYVDIFTKWWRSLVFAKSLRDSLVAYTWLLWILPFVIYSGWTRVGFPPIPVAGMLVSINKKAPTLFWLIYLLVAPSDKFETDFRQSCRDTLSSARSGTQKVAMISIFVGDNSISVPVLFSRTDATESSDAETFRQLRTWYSWLQYNRGFGEVILPKKLTRIDKVKVCRMSSDNPVLGGHIKSYDLGRTASSNIVNFLNPGRLDPKQFHQTEDMMSDVTTEGLEFIRAWDRKKVSGIAMVPFALSLVFAIIWIAVSIGRYNVDAQVAVQTAFTVAAFIVTAGALLIALFAFLDDKTGQT